MKIENTNIFIAIEKIQKKKNLIYLKKKKIILQIFYEKNKLLKNIKFALVI